MDEVPLYFFYYLGAYLCRVRFRNQQTAERPSNRAAAECEAG